MARKAFRIARLCASLLAVISLATAPTVKAGAGAYNGIGDTLFEKIKGVIAGSVDPDHIEMARFSIAYPDQAATIYTRAAAQDYPFFGMVGAVKAARKTGFTHAQCMTPITAIDTVFAKASSTIDQGKAQTDGAMASASALAAEYAKAKSDEARQELIDQLSATVPYFGDIPTICTFAFETDFAVERNIQRYASQISQDVRTAYNAFKTGDVVTGVEMLLVLGASNAVACEMVDQAVGGGVIGRTPILGALAKDACSGFVGTVIDGVKGLVKGGVGFAEDGLSAAAGGGKALVCAVYSWIGNGCSAAEPPPTGYSTAAAWCVPHGGIRSLLSRTNQPDDYSVECGDGSQCSAKPGQVAMCATGAEIAAHEAQKIALNDLEFRGMLPQWQAVFAARWLPKCPDEACKAEILQVRANATQLAEKQHAERPDYGFMMATYFPFEAADRQAVSVVDDYRYRILPGRWAQLYQSRWSEDCEDNICRTAVRIVAANVRLQIQQKAEATPRPPYGSTAATYSAAEQQAAGFVAESVQRINDFNKKTTADAGVAWEQLAIGIWVKQCADAPCVTEIEQLAAQMRVAGNLLQLADPDASSLSVQNKVALEYGPKFKAAVTQSQTRAAQATPSVAPTRVRAAGPLRPYLQPVRRVRPNRRAAPQPPVGRDRTAPPPPAGRERTAPPPVIRSRTQLPPPAPARPAPNPVILRPVPAPTPAAGSPPVFRRIIIRPTPTPTPSPTPGGRPPPIRR